jgi:colicin import membrane protein
MPRKLKTYQTSQGFYDLAVAAPSMKAALEAWGSKQNLFHQGFAKETDESEVVAAVMANPGVVLRRPVGSAQPFREHADLPTMESLNIPHTSKAPSAQERPKAGKPSQKEARRAAFAYERESERRQRNRQKQEAAAAKTRERRQAAVSKAEAAFESAKREHETAVANIEKDRAAIERRDQAEKARWEKVRARLESALRKARE